MDYKLRDSHDSGIDSSGKPWSYSHTWEVLSVAKADAGPCIDCGKPMAALNARQHVTHNGIESRRTLGLPVYAHADGSEPHLAPAADRPHPQCPKCKAYGTLTYRQLPYGDETTCTCGYRHYYSIGD